ncbi:carbohydrate-binding module family 12 protein [Melanogaster broomeanus]|nr:carbohydrate-binding module family 12 protein [Melanogaster broomeanus]
MAPRWQPGEEYNYGDVVEFEDVDYKIIQPHRSQGDWTPPVTPALWGRVQRGREHHPHHQSSGQWGEDCKPSRHSPGHEQQQQHQHQQQQQHHRREPDETSYSTPAVQPTTEEANKHWYNLNDEQKKEADGTIGGVALAGVAAAGAGYYAYKQHGKNEEEKKTHEWASNNWIRESQARTQQWRSGQYNAPVAWIWNEGTSIPRDAIQGGEEDGEPHYICRAYQDVLVGKASRVFEKGAVIGYKKHEIQVGEYEILVGDSRAVRWVSCSGQLNLQGLRATTVEGGKEPDGTPQYVGQAPYHGAVVPGKVCESFGGCFIPYDGTEKKVEEYSVLCYA